MTEHTHKVSLCQERAVINNLNVTMRAFVRYIAFPLVVFATVMIMINGSIGPAIVGIIIALYLWIISRK